MNITDELRKFADEFERTEWNGLAERAREIADRIDEAHRKALEKVAAMVDEEIVRCKDCSCMEQRISFDGSIGWFLCTRSNRPTRRDGFCAWGERRDA